MKKILVAGGAGFIGSHLCDFFIEKNLSVVCLDNLITGRKENIAHLFSNRKFVFVHHDINSPISVEGKIDFVLNFASPASPVDYLKYPVETLKTGALGSINLLDLAQKKSAKYLLASTSEVYGDPLESPQKESYWGNVNPVGPRSVYDEAKRFAEAVTMAYRRRFGTNTQIIRIFNTYGPRLRKDDGRVVSNFIIQALNKKPLTVYGEGKQTRSFCYIDDLVDGIWRIMNTNFSGPINLGNPAEFTVLQLAKMVSQVAGVSLKIKRQALPVDDPQQRRPDITMARRKLGWRPKVSIDEGVVKTLNWFKEN